MDGGVRSCVAMQDPFAPADVIRVYPPVLRLLQGGDTAERRPPYCACPRVVKTDGRIIVWHRHDCDEPRREDDLAAIL